MIIRFFFYLSNSKQLTNIHFKIHKDLNIQVRLQHSDDLQYLAQELSIVPLYS